MNREIKFRVWDGDRMIQPVDSASSYEVPELAIATNGIVLRGGDNGACGDPDCCGEYKEYLIATDFILMQSIGLVDKNGKELFEGDIIQHTRPDGIYAVEWVDGAASFALRKPGHTMWLGKLCEPLCEVIGNIHENRDLLPRRNP